MSLDPRRMAHTAEGARADRAREVERRLERVERGTSRARVTVGDGPPSSVAVDEGMDYFDRASGRRWTYAAGRWWSAQYT